MVLRKERKRIIDVCKKMIKDGLTNGTAGNVSVFNREEGLIALTPTGIPYDILKEEEISIVDLEGKLINGKQPTSELDMHLIFYKNRPEINSVIHGHTIYSTSIACLRKPLPAIDYMIAVTGDKEVRCAEYASYGTKQLAINAFETMRGSKAVLLANHGITCVGKNLDEAYNILSQIEYISKLYITSSQIGTPVILEDDELYKMINRFKNYGQKAEEVS